jgi:peptidoglycan/LPS O-acetylase OafA/YrhL
MKASHYISALTPLRGIAALLVILLHFNIFIAKLTADGLTHVFDKLYLMVDLFFVLSGFIMYHVYGDMFKREVSRGAFLTFMKARFARIYPLHLVTFLFVLALPLLLTLTNTPQINNFFGMAFDYTAIPSQLLLTQAMGTHHEATWNSPSWSISVEWWAYVVFPFLVMFLVSTRIWSRLLIALLITAGYAVITYYAQPLFWGKRWEMLNLPSQIPFPVHNIDVITGPFGFLRCLCGFLFGMLVYEGYQKSWGKKWLGSSLMFCGIWFVLLCLWHFDVTVDFFAVAGFGLIILSASYNDSKVREVFTHKSLQFLGDISYSLYLVHMPLLFFYITLRKIVIPDDSKQLMLLGYNFSLVQAWIGFAVFLIATLIVASFTYRYIEKPARAYLNSTKRAVAVA